MNKIKRILIYTFCLFCTLYISCSKKDDTVRFDFNKTNKRIWIGQDFWAVPMEDFRVENGRIECIADRGNSRVNVLTHYLTNRGELSLSVKTGMMDPEKNAGSVGFTIGLQDDTDNDVRSLCYFGKGIPVGISLSGSLYIGEESGLVPEDFDFSEMLLSIEAKRSETENSLTLTVTDKNGIQKSIISHKDFPLKGIFTLASNHPKKFKKRGTFWFDEGSHWILSGL